MAPAVSRADLLKALAEVQLDALTVAEARDKGTVAVPEPKSELLTAPEPAAPATASADRGKGATLSEVLKAFHGERTAGNRTLSEGTMGEHKVAVRMFDEFMGAAVPVQSITRADMLGYKQALLKTPNRYNLRFKGMTLPQAIKANAKRKEPFPTLDPQTINMKWLSHISTILKWASNNGYVDANPASGVRVDEGTASRNHPASRSRPTTSKPSSAATCSESGQIRHPSMGAVGGALFRRTFLKRDCPHPP